MARCHGLGGIRLVDRINIEGGESIAALLPVVVVRFDGANLQLLVDREAARVSIGREGVSSRAHSTTRE